MVKIRYIQGKIIGEILFIVIILSDVGMILLACKFECVWYIFSYRGMNAPENNLLGTCKEGY